MGSTDKAVITGFICRLCSKMNRFVIHIYGEEGERMRLAEKINAYLPITISINDPLPKTVCLPCIDLLEAHHELMEQFTWARQRLAEAKAAENPQKSVDPSQARDGSCALPGCSSSSQEQSMHEMDTRTHE
ncbi:uncharacterized protein LOC110840467 [Zootermopsis nevadensis]|uniref:ZAD domain-containing protein n=1 Tax=Zootermopsis nevadensis TaxID=136037 RepID=A0A067QIC2_ZOONE|nr:uncharacterized protein LOC110840467 [Zootermopsis nevadensis]KDR06669.1 hypothetical protein L798_03940 [Zootermopsis nevadensis]